MSVCVCICEIFHCFMGPVCLKRTMSVLQVQYSGILHYSHNMVSEKYITFTVLCNHTYQQGLKQRLGGLNVIHK